MMREIKTWKIWLILMALTFIISGLFLNILQFLCYKIIKPTSKNLYRKINYYLIYSSWAQMVAVAEWWSGTKVKLFYDSREARDNFGKEHSLVIMNHKYEVDWLVCWMLCDKLRMLGNAKCFAKKSLMKIPVIGWGWAFSEMIFLERNWEKDSQIIGTMLDELVTYQDPMMLLLFCEGTRFTQEKYEASIEFAKSKNLPLLKYHLLPRTKGFNHCMKHLKQTTDAIYSVQLAFPPDLPPPTLGSIFQGKIVYPNAYVKRYPTKDIPDTDEECSKFLYDMYQHKDEVMDTFMKTGKFPGECVVAYRRRFTTVGNLLFWLCAVGYPVASLLWSMIVSGNNITLMIASTIIVLVLALVYFMMSETKIKKGSSYGTTRETNKKKENGHLHNEENSNKISNEQNLVDSPSEKEDSSKHLSNDETQNVNKSANGYDSRAYS